MPVPIERKRKSSTPRATPCQCSPSAARLTSFSSDTERPSRLLEVAAERDALEPRDARRERDPAPLGVDDAGDADDGAVQERAVEARRGHEARAEVGDLVEDARRVAAVDLDVEPRPHVAAEVADRAAQEPAADVEPEHERRLGDGLEEDGAVPRPGRLARRLADEARVEQRLERERHRRLRDAGAPRDLGARDRRARADRLEHRPLVQVLEERRERGSRDTGVGSSSFSDGILTTRADLHESLDS